MELCLFISNLIRYYITPSKFFRPALLKSEQQVSRTILSILVHLNNGVVWMVLARPPITNFSCSLYLVFRDNSKGTGYNCYNHYLHNFLVI